jgi:hypothetical protein
VKQETSSQKRNQQITATDGAIALVIILLIAQVWLLSSTLNAFLAGHPETAAPAAIVSGILFAGCASLYRFVGGLDRARD